MSDPIPTPINAIITAVCLNIFSEREACDFTELQVRVEQEVGYMVGDGFLASELERQGYKVNDKVKPWTVNA
jgi:hypothetical protein